LLKICLFFFLLFFKIFDFEKLFKLEKYNECVEYYRSLLKNNPDEYQSTRQANFIAALATWKLSDPSSKIQLVNSIN